MRAFWNAKLAVLAFVALIGLKAGVALAGANVWTTGGPEGGIVYRLAIDPVTPTTVYAGTYGAGVFKSVSGGESWTAANTDLTTTVVFALAIDPVTPATVYAGTRGGGVFKSINGGES